MRRPLVIGNWKMNGSAEFTQDLLAGLAKDWVGVHKAEMVVCPPYLYLPQTSQILENTNISWGAQDLSIQKSGAYTGEIAANMLADFGCKYVIVGHSERREYHGETSGQVAKKFKAAIDGGMIPVLCVGESLEERETDKTYEIIGSQLREVVDYCGLDLMVKGVIAYEPVWAIGTGKSATPELAQDVHSYIREVLGPEGDSIRILYGGSVKPETAEGLFGQKDIDGALVGGASLKAQDFVGICRATE